MKLQREETVSRKWDWINAARNTITKYQTFLEEFRSELCKDESSTIDLIDPLVTTSSCAYCILCERECHRCIQTYIKSIPDEAIKPNLSCQKFSTYTIILRYYNYFRESSIYDIIDARIQFHEKVIEFLMGMPEYATDDYIFDKIKQLELK